MVHVSVFIKAFQEAFSASRTTSFIRLQQSAVVSFDHVAVNERLVYDGDNAFRPTENSFYFIQASFGLPSDVSFPVPTDLQVALHYGMDNLIMYSNVTGVMATTNSVNDICKLTSGDVVFVTSDLDMFSDINGQTSFMGFRIDKSFSPLALFKAVTLHGDLQFN